MKDLAQRFSEHWKAKGFPRNKTVLLALSGGVDSMVLAHLLRDSSISFAAAHCNFSLRGNDADDDAAFVQEWCNQNGIACHQRTFKTKEIATERKQSIQVTARALRYDWFDALRRTHDYAATLTAHHGDDVAETMLINLSRGTGIAGLHGIPETSGHIIRPLLFTTRAEILEYATKQGVAWREDASNATDDYLRNAIRLHIIPKLEELLPGAASRIARTAERLSGAELIYRKALEQRLTKLKEQRGNNWYIPIRLLQKEPALATIAYELFAPLGFSGEQIPLILSLMQSESGKQILSYTHRVIRHRDFLVVTAAESDSADLILIESVPATIETSAGAFHFEWKNGNAPISEDANVAMLHGDELQFPLVLRTKREGDYFYPLGMGMKKKKLKRFLIDLKVPLHEKEQIRILESDKKILWIAGRRIDERAKVRLSTQQILQVTFQPK
jgi:tRNA(Ile)-lysidine synthase